MPTIVAGRDEAIAEIISDIYKELHTTDLTELLKFLQEDKGIEVIANGLKHNLATYNRKSKMIVVGTEFIDKNRNDMELVYILLYVYYYAYLDMDGAMPKDDWYFRKQRVYVDIVFEQNNVEIPERFIWKIKKKEI